MSPQVKGCASVLAAGLGDEEVIARGQR